MLRAEISADKIARRVEDGSPRRNRARNLPRDWSGRLGAPGTRHMHLHDPFTTAVPRTVALARSVANGRTPARYDTPAGMPLDETIQSRSSYACGIGFHRARRLTP